MDRLIIQILPIFLIHKCLQILKYHRILKIKFTVMSYNMLMGKLPEEAEDQ